jgi:hypothetical protein
METVIIILAAVISVLSILLMIWLRSNQKRITKNYVSRALELGFVPFQEDDPVFLFRLANLHKKFDLQRLEARNVYRRKGSDHQLFLFDLFSIDVESPTRLREAVMAVQSTLLRTPRISITPKLEPSGFPSFLGKMLHPITDAFLSPEFAQIHFERSPEFERRYAVFGQDEEAVKEFLSDQVRWRLSRDHHWQIEAERDLFTLNRLGTEYLKTLKADIDLKQLVREALVIFDLFRER